MAPPALGRRPGPARQAPESAFRAARARRSDGGWTHDDDGSSERVRAAGAQGVASERGPVEGATRVLDRWSRLADGGRLTPAR